MKVYLVYIGYACDKMLKRIYTDKTKADEFSRELGRQHEFDDVRVEEMEISEDVPKVVPYWFANIDMMTGDTGHDIEEGWTFDPESYVNAKPNFRIGDDQFPAIIRVVSLESPEAAIDAAIKKRKELIEECGGIDNLMAMPGTYRVKILK